MRRHKREGESALPGSLQLCHELRSLRGGRKELQKSAEGIVVPFDRSEGPNVKERTRDSNFDD